MKKVKNPVPQIDPKQVFENAIAFENFAGQSIFTSEPVKTKATVEEVLPLPVTAMLLF